MDYLTILFKIKTIFMQLLKKLNLGNIDILSRDQMMSIHGGDAINTQTLDDPIANVCSASCWQSTGSWIYTHPVTYTECSQDVWAYCATGAGTCYGCGGPSQS